MSNELALAKDLYPRCHSLLGAGAWERALVASGGSLAGLPGALAELVTDPEVPPFLPELARLEQIRHRVATNGVQIPSDVEELTINPTLTVCELSWALCQVVVRPKSITTSPERRREHALVWRDGAGEVHVQPASDGDLLALKIVAEDIPPEQVVAAGAASAERVEALLEGAAQSGILLAPRPRIRRAASDYASRVVPERFLVADSFTLQWHITNACDLRCTHCYDRSDRSELSLDKGLTVLDDLVSFCRSQRVRGHVCFTGGNPVLHPSFLELYRGAAERGFSMSVLGNPIPRASVERIIAVQRPTYFQISLEGLRERNDAVRGPGSFDRALEFLAVLGQLEVSSAVMLTLTRDNIRDVLPLAALLRDRTDHFTFNRLSPFGEGAQLELPTREEYESFLSSYVDATADNPSLGIKDNLINVVNYDGGHELFGGCTGYGCGAAFNFVALLADGEVHACRKFPSRIGDVHQQGIAEIYSSPAAQQYRSGCTACKDCAIRPVCGGCMSVAAGHGLDPFTERDPHCFMKAL